MQTYIMHYAGQRCVIPREKGDKTLLMDIWLAKRLKEKTDEQPGAIKSRRTVSAVWRQMKINTIKA